VFENIFILTPVTAPVPICTVHFFFLTSAVKGKHWCQGKGMLKPINNYVSSSQPCFLRTVGCMVWWKLCCSHCLCWKMWWWILWFHSQLTCVLRSLIHTRVLKLIAHENSFLIRQRPFYSFNTMNMFCNLCEFHVVIPGWHVLHDQYWSRI